MNTSHNHPHERSGRSNHTRPVTTPARRSRWLTLGLPVTAVVVLIGGSALAWLLTPPPMPADADDALRLLTSARFARLDDAGKHRYQDRIGELFRDMDADQRRAFRDQMRGNDDLREALGRMMRDRMRQQARDFATATPAERLAMLDQIIDQQEQWRGRGEGGPRPEGGPPPGFGGDRRERMADRFEQGNPQDQALMGEFFRAMRTRREQRNR
jgi:hypothetical protein